MREWHVAHGTSCHHGRENTSLLGCFWLPVRYVWEISELKMVLQSDKRHTVPQDP